MGEVVIYCIVPRELAEALLDTLRRFYGADPSVRVIVEKRVSNRRIGERRPRDAGSAADEHRAPAGAGERRARERKVEDRRAPERRTAPAALPHEATLPHEAQRFADRIRFVRRIEPLRASAAEADTLRLVRCMQAGDESAATEIYMRYFEQVYGYARVVLRNRHEAEDATQQVFEALLRSIHRYRIEDEESSFTAWLFTVARNTVIKAVRRKGREKADPVEQRDLERYAPSVEGPLDQILRRLSDDELGIFIRRLPAAQREVIVLRHVVDMSIAQIAQATGRTPEAVRQLHSRARQALASRLTAAGRGPARRPTPALESGPRRRGAPMLIRIRPARVIINRRFALR